MSADCESERRPALIVGSRYGAKGNSRPNLQRPDLPNQFGIEAAWNGAIVEVYGRTSRPATCGDARSLVQIDDFPRELLAAGYGVRINYEQGVSGKHVEASDRRYNRVVLQSIIGRLIARESHCLAVLELSRLARDASGKDAAYLKMIIRDHCSGRIITRRKMLDLFDEADSREYDTECRLAGWRREDDVEKSMDGYRRYIEDVAAGRREISMPHRLSFGYRREPVVNNSSKVQTLASRRARTKVVMDDSLIDTMEAFRRAANNQLDASRLARELNQAHLPGPIRYRPPGQQWSRQAIRRLLSQDIYAGLWTPGRKFESDEVGKYLIQNGFNPAEQQRVEPRLAWFTRTELDAWRAKFLDKKKILRTRKYDHPLSGLVACATCSERLGEVVYLTRQGRPQISASGGREKTSTPALNDSAATAVMA